VPDHEQIQVFLPSSQFLDILSSIFSVTIMPKVHIFKVDLKSAHILLKYVQGIETLVNMFKRHLYSTQIFNDSISMCVSTGRNIRRNRQRRQ
jgi:hypothetical protein